MSKQARRRNLVIILLLLVGIVLLLLLRCSREEAPARAAVGQPPAVGDASEGVPAAVAPVKPAAAPEEVLTPATLQAPREVGAGAAFSVTWTGPNNTHDFITLVRPDAADGVYGNYRDVKDGNPLQLTAPSEAGEWELRYMTSTARAVLARVPLTVTAASATLDAPAEAVLGTALEVAWTGPNNAQDYITVVPPGTPEGRYGNYTETKKGSPLAVTLPPEAGEAELRYVTGQGAKVLARRPLRIVAPEIRMTAPAQVVAGSVVTVEWVGPNNAGDYITLVPAEMKDGQYGNYTDARKGSPLTVTAPIMEGPAELRYMTGQGGKVLGRRPIRIVAAEVTLTAPAEVKAGELLNVEWKGPDHPGDYITLVPAGTPDGQYRGYADTRTGSPMKIAAPKEPGEAELRYMSGQGAKVLKRRAVRVVEP
ncbi:MAG TPA: hypothetical protein VEQ65_07675 [Opitutus sp.]|nr:hypothetical protein [Opitutus sp.]